MLTVKPHIQMILPWKKKKKTTGRLKKTFHASRPNAENKYDAESSELQNNLMNPQFVISAISKILINPKLRATNK